jgi:glycosyltransferase involved in cell wall biosynthesis
MLVSVVIPARNMARYLPLAIESVLSQSCTSWDLHVVDDGSTDHTPDVVRRYLTDPRVHYWTQPNQERAVARNKGIGCSAGEYIAFLDADDLWQPDKLSKQIAILDRDRSAALCYTHARYIDSEGRPLTAEKHLAAREGKVLPELIRGNFIPVSSAVVRKQALDSVGFFDTDARLIGAEDWDLWLRIAAAFPIRLAPEELTLYRVHNTPRSHRQILNGALAVVRKQFSSPEFAVKAGLTEAAAEACAYLSSAGFASPAVTRPERLKLLLKAVSIAPTSILSSSGFLASARVALPSRLVAMLKRITPLLN